MTAPFMFAWADADETTFTEQHWREDEDVFDMKCSQAEGNCAVMQVTIRNPRIGLLSVHRKKWAWLSWINPANGGVEPICFARLVAVPSNMFLETVTLEFDAHPPDFGMQKAALVEALKVRPFYDPIWLDPAHRDDPDAILEGHQKVWTCERVPASAAGLQVSLTHILWGEDEMIEYWEGDDIPYDSLSMNITQPPLDGVNMDATVTWTQEMRGTLKIGDYQISSWAGGTIVGEWPKTGTGLSGGWSVDDSYAYDMCHVNELMTASVNLEYQNKEKKHEIGDTMHVSYSGTAPANAQGPIWEALLCETKVIGISDPNDPDWHDEPTSSYWAQYAYIPMWKVAAKLSLRYDQARQRSEHVVFTLFAGIQPVFTAPESPALPVEETIKVASVDLSQPLANVLDWGAIRNQQVEIGQIIYPNLPNIRGGTSFQICWQAGIAGNTEPTNFSDTPGQLTNDGTVIWRSLGKSLTIEAPDWTGNMFVPYGAIIRPLPPIYQRWADLQPPPGSWPYTPGGSLSLWQYVEMYGAYYIVTAPGTININPPTLQWIWNQLPTGTVFYEAMTEGMTNAHIPPNWPTTPGATVQDGDITWRCLGTGGTFIDLPIGDLTRRSYLPTDRGLWSLEYLICMAMAKLAKRARMVEVKFELPFAEGLRMSCRKNIKINSPRIPGGSCIGKVVAYELEGNGDSKVFKTSVTMECCVGQGGTVTPEDGIGYVESGYVMYGYDYQEGDIDVINDSTVAYSIPLDEPADDGLVWPLTKPQVVVREQIWGSLQSQAVGVRRYIDAQASIAQVAARQALQRQISGVSLDAATQIATQIWAAMQSRLTFDVATAPYPIWFDLEVRAIDPGPFNTEFQIILSDFKLPKQIDLEAESADA